MVMTVLFEEQVEVPLDIRSLADFRRWAVSDEFPERGRIDFINGRIEVDMSPENIFFHGTVKSEIAAVLQRRVKNRRLGHLLIDRTRISSPRADVSAEPDIVFISYEAFDTGQCRLVPSASGDPDQYIEVEGAPDLIVEIVSDSSVHKDTRRLPPAYFQAGVGEFWLVDARRGKTRFVIHRRGGTGYEPVETDGEGFQVSRVLGCRFRLDARRDARGHWEYDLVEKEL